MINERAQPTLPEPDSAGFEDVLAYVRQISASQGFGTKFTLAGNEVEVSAG
jgi:hypothetical protein